MEVQVIFSKEIWHISLMTIQEDFVEMEVRDGHVES